MREIFAYALVSILSAIVGYLFAFIFTGIFGLSIKALLTTLPLTMILHESVIAGIYGAIMFLIANICIIVYELK